MEATQSEGGGLNDAFLVVYRMVALFGMLGFVLITLLALFDVIMYYWNEISQKLKLTLDPNMPNKDTTDIDILRYLANDIDNEPYNVFLQQKVIQGVYAMIGFALVVFGIQIASFFVLKIVAIVKELPFKEKFDIPMTNIGIIVIVFSGITALNYIYKHVFLKDTQPTLKDVRSQLRDIKSFIYQNIDYDRVQNKFLPAMLSNDMDSLIEALKSKLQEATRPNSKLLQPTDMSVIRMLFALNLFTYFHYEIPESDPASDEIRKMFTADGLRSQKVDPSMYFYYKKPIYITNMYPSLRKELKKVLGPRERPFIHQLSILMRDLNRKLARLQMISSGKKKIDDYLWKVLVISVLITIALLVVHFGKYSYIIAGFFAVKSMISSVIGHFTKKT